MIGKLGVDTATLPADALVALLALLVGYLIGSIPLAALIGRAARVDAGEASPGSADGSRPAGPGWGLLALSGDLARGVLPVALGTVTFSWSAGWAAGLGALLGACWPLFGRLPGGRGVAVGAGIVFALSPGAGSLAALLTLCVLVAARLLRRSGRVAGIAAGLGAYPLLFLADQGDLVRLAGLMTLYLVALLRHVTSPR